MALHFNSFRNLKPLIKKIPDIAIHTYFKRMEEPEYHEGFRQIITLRLDTNFDNEYTKNVLEKYIRTKYDANNVITDD